MTEPGKREREIYIINSISPKWILNDIRTVEAVINIHKRKPITTVLCDKLQSRTDSPYPSVGRYCQDNKIRLITRKENQSIDDFLKERVMEPKYSEDRDLYVYITSEKDINVLDKISRDILRSDIFVELVRIYP